MAEDDDGSSVAAETPVLVVDWTRAVQRLLPSCSCQEGTHAEAQDTGELWSALRERFQTHDAMCEALFEAEAAVHSTSREAQDVVNQMHSAHGRADHLIRQERYPALDTGHAVDEVWPMLEKDSTWQAVNALRDLICDCNRPVPWKLHMAMEVENLALKQEMFNTAERLGALAGSNSGNNAQQHVAQHQGSELEPFDPSNPHMNILDRIIAMCLSRMPPPLEPAAHAQHTQTLMQLHMGVRAMWLNEFGALPASVLWGAGVGDASNDGDTQTTQQQRQQPCWPHREDGHKHAYQGGTGSSHALGSDLASFSMAGPLGLFSDESGPPAPQKSMFGDPRAIRGLFGLQDDEAGDAAAREEEEEGDEKFASVFRFKPMMAFLDEVEDGTARGTADAASLTSHHHHHHHHQKNGDDDDDDDDGDDDWLPFRDELDDEEGDADDPLADAFADAGTAYGSSLGSSESGSEYEADDEEEEPGDDGDSDGHGNGVGGSDSEGDAGDGGMLDAFFQAPVPGSFEAGVGDEEEEEEEEEVRVGQAHESDVGTPPPADSVQSSDPDADPNTQGGKARQSKKKVLLS